MAIASRLSELLAQQAGHQVILVSDCLTTLKFLQYCKPDLILLDDRLLHSNGIELGPRLALMKDLQDIPIFVLGTDILGNGLRLATPLRNDGEPLTNQDERIILSKRGTSVL
jgi:CheY-like chemotaxis protein